MGAQEDGEVNVVGVSIQVSRRVSDLRDYIESGWS